MGFHVIIIYTRDLFMNVYYQVEFNNQIKEVHS